MEFDFSVPKWSKIMLNAPSFKVLKLVKKPLYNTDEIFIPTLGSWINVPSGINVPPGTFDKRNKLAPWKIDPLC